MSYRELEEVTTETSSLAQQSTTTLPQQSTTTLPQQSTSTLAQQITSSPATSRLNGATFEDLLVIAAEDVLGEDIQLRDHSTTKKNMASFKTSLSISVIRREETPTPVGRTIVDVFAKEFKNNGVPDDKNPTAGDITKAFVHKTREAIQGRNYRFISNQGIVWNMGDTFGLQMLAMGVSGGSMGLHGQYRQNVTSLSTVADALGASLGFKYSQEENITIPPGKKIYVTVTTYIIEYHINYKLEFCVPKWRTVYVSYRKPCCLCKCKKSAYIPYRQMVCNLPEFREDSHYAYFTQEGVLSWIGESCEVNKREAPVQ